VSNDSTFVLLKVLQRQSSLICPIKRFPRLGGGAYRPHPRDESAEEKREGIARKSHNVPRSRPEIKDGRSTAKDGTP